MGAANITENPRPGEDLRPYVIAILDLLRGTQVPRSPAGIVVPSGAAHDAARPDLGTVAQPFENVYANAMLLGGLSLYNEDLASTVGLHFVDDPGDSVFVWPWRGRTRALCILFSGSGGGGSSGGTQSNANAGGGGGGASGNAGAAGGLSVHIQGRPLYGGGGDGGAAGTAETEASDGSQDTRWGNDSGLPGTAGGDSKVEFGSTVAKTNGLSTPLPNNLLLPSTWGLAGGAGGGGAAAGGAGAAGAGGGGTGGAGAAGSMLIKILDGLAFNTRINITVGAAGRGGAVNPNSQNPIAGADGLPGKVIILST